MNDWSTVQWAIVLLAFLAGLFLGFAMSSGGKWKRRYKENEVLLKDERRRREELEREKTHWEAQTIAAKARDPQTPAER